MVLLAALTGLIMGAISALFRFLIYASHEVFFSHGTTSPFSLSSITAHPFAALFQVSLPFLGALIVGLLIYKVLNLRGGHGVPSVMKAVATGHVNLPPSMAVKSSSSIITITSGGSCGPEGPIMEIGAVIGSFVGSKGELSRERIGTLIGCGAAAGIAGIFDAPIGGVFLALELIMRDFAVRTFGPVVIAALIASMTSEALLPNTPVFPFLQQFLQSELMDTVQFGFGQAAMFSLLGIVTGLGGALLVYALYKAHDFFQSLKMPTWMKPALGGLGVGLVGLAFPTVIGEGYMFVNDAILEEFGFAQMALLIPACQFLLIAVVKIFVTSLTLGSGSTGGSFAPAMVTGAMIGAGLGILCNYFAPNFSPAIPIFALVGMAGCVCGALGIPIAAFLIIYEITGADYRLMPPLILTVSLSALVAASFRQGSVYTLSLLRDGFDVEEAMKKVVDPLSRVPIAKIMSKRFTTLSPEDELNQVLDALSTSDDDAFAVVGEGGHLVGMISTHDLRAVLNLGDLGAAIIASDAADTHPPMLYPDSLASEALNIFSTTDADGIPVVEKPGSRQIIGMVSRVDVLSAYRQAATKDQ